MSSTTCVSSSVSSRHPDDSQLIFSSFGPIGFVDFQWDGVPGRGECIRLVFEYSGTPYDEVKDNSTLMTRISDPEVVGIPPNLWPPALELPNGKWLSQTGVIINYLSPKLGLAGYATDDTSLDEDDKSFLSAKNTQLFLTILDLVVEVSVGYFGGLVRWLFIESRLQVHSVHHPVSTNLYYEDQKAEALRAAEQFRTVRLLKFFQYFQSVFETNPANKDGKGDESYLGTIIELAIDVADNGEGPFLLSNLTTAADLALFNVLNGLQYAFPKKLKNLRASGLCLSKSVPPPLTTKPNRQIRSHLQGPPAHPE